MGLLSQASLSAIMKCTTRLRVARPILESTPSLLLLAALLLPWQCWNAVSISQSDSSLILSIVYVIDEGIEWFTGNTRKVQIHLLVQYLFHNNFRGIPPTQKSLFRSQMDT